MKKIIAAAALSLFALMGATATAHADRPCGSYGAGSVYCGSLNVPGMDTPAHKAASVASATKAAHQLRHALGLSN